MRNRQAVVDFLNRKYEEYNRPAFIESDPVQVPHRFSQPADIEIAGLFAALFAWGNRRTIINKATELMALMDNAPHAFVLQHEEKDRQRFLSFAHRTFNATDLLYFLEFLQQHYRQHPSLEKAFLQGMQRGDKDTTGALDGFHRYFFSLDDAPARTRKHIAAPFRGSSCKRLNMYLRWMVRSDGRGVDFGIWQKIKPAQLVIPIDLHVARVAKRLGVLSRETVDWQAALELTDWLRSLDKNDPVKYDFALFALGVVEKF
ncbi:MAG TPA: TIGR02757 family protein [Flavihumibacter sp.]|nr:TIGR02757 family protein [Flavihumibacter sp.]HPZ87144.1 TIGR02757 family protein [Flavihumibacter sp.]